MAVDLDVLIKVFMIDSHVSIKLAACAGRRPSVAGRTVPAITLKHQVII
jgi:hypothetical protein